VFKGLLPHFCVGKIFFFFLIWPIRIKSMPLWFPKSQQIVFHISLQFFVCVLYPLCLCISNTFGKAVEIICYTLNVLNTHIYIKKFDFHNLQHISWKKCLLDITTLPSLVFKADLVIKKIHPRSYHPHFFMCGLILHFGLCHIIFIVAHCILLIIWVHALHLSCIPLFVFLLYFALNFLNFIVVLLEIWQHFMLLVVQTSPSWSMIQGWPLFSNIICALRLLFS
jgi:hypothetical protein